MARILIATTPAAGHVNPMAALVSELINRGHTVWWYTGKAFQRKVELLGAHYQPLETAYDFSGMSREEAVPQTKGLQGAKLFITNMQHFFIKQAPAQMADILKILEQFPADMLLADDFCFGAGFVKEKTGILLVNISNSIYFYNSRDTAPIGAALLPDSSFIGRIRNRILNWVSNNIILRHLRPDIDRARARVELPKRNQSILERINEPPDLYLLGTIPQFEYPRSDLSENTHFVGSFISLPPEQFNPPAWWHELEDERPVVLVTQGTIANDNLNELIFSTTQALARENLLVIATTGGTPMEMVELRGLPENVRIEPFVPYHFLLPRIDAMITNGGYGGVQMALSHGVPVIVAGATEEKPEIANRVVWTGVGINLKTGTPSPKQIHGAVQTILNNREYKQNAQQLQREHQLYKAPQRAADLIEQFLKQKGIPRISRADSLEKLELGVTPISD